jgi:hypothetical protein
MVALWRGATIHRTVTFADAEEPALISQRIMAPRSST